MHVCPPGAWKPIDARCLGSREGKAGVPAPNQRTPWTPQSAARRGRAGSSVPRIRRRVTAFISYGSSSARLLCLPVCLPSSKPQRCLSLKPRQLRNALRRHGRFHQRHPLRRRARPIKELLLPHRTSPLHTLADLPCSKHARGRGPSWAEQSTDTQQVPVALYVCLVPHYLAVVDAGVDTVYDNAAPRSFHENVRRDTSIDKLVRPRPASSPEPFSFHHLSPKKTLFWQTPHR